MKGKKLLDKLRNEAFKAATARGHTVSSWLIIDEETPGHFTANSLCEKCGKRMEVDTMPQPNGINIGGEMVALNCE